MTPKVVAEMRKLAYAAPSVMPKSLRSKLVAGQEPLRDLFAYIDALEAEVARLKCKLEKASTE